MEFPGFLGNEEVKAALSAAFDSGRFPHTVILQGERGTGKRTLSGLIARALVCRNGERAPCGTCPSCIRALSGSHPDIRIVEGSGATRSLTVEMIREVTSDAYRMPEEAKVNVYQLFLGDRTLEAAQNKLLKLIEEPPENTVFLLVCESERQLLPTVRSRAQSFTLKPPSLEEAAECVGEKAGLEPEKAKELSLLCGGNIGQMLGELSEGEQGQALSAALRMVKGILSTGEHSLLEASAPLIRDRKLALEALRRLELILRDACVLRFGGRAVLGGAPQEAQALCALPKKRLSALPELIEDFRDKISRNANMTLLITDLCARLRERE